MPENQGKWEGLYWGAVRKDQDVTFDQLYSRFAYKTAVEAGTQEHPAFWKAYYPERTLKLMPMKPNTWHRKISEISRDELY